jgi:hypothetical protein
MNMSVKVVIPKHLGRYVNGKSEIDVEASDLRATLEKLSHDYKLEDIFLTREGHLQAFIRIVVDEDLVLARKAEDLSQVTVSGKIVEIQTAFAGG